MSRKLSSCLCVYLQGRCQCWGSASVPSCLWWKWTSSILSHGLVSLVLPAIIPPSLGAIAWEHFMILREQTEEEWNQMVMSFHCRRWLCGGLGSFRWDCFPQPPIAGAGGMSGLCYEPNSRLGQWFWCCGIHIRWCVGACEIRWALSTCSPSVSLLVKGCVVHPSIMLSVEVIPRDLIERWNGL